jgi:hypothetical protein
MERGDEGERGESIVSSLRNVRLEAVMEDLLAEETPLREDRDGSLPGNTIGNGSRFMFGLIIFYSKEN